MGVLRSRWNAFAVGGPGLAVFLVVTSLNVAVLRATSFAAQQADTWTAPSDAKTVKNPVRTTTQSLKEASELFQHNCASCHGAKGAGDGVLAKALVTKPANFTEARRMNRETDGELYWKITNGRAPMPGWMQLPEHQRWELVNYIRTLARRGVSQRKKD
jgi:mono/diheme cytochrome c family protein